MSFIASLDIGTTTVRCIIFDVSNDFQVKGSWSELVNLVTTKPGHFEIEPEGLWESVQCVLRNAIQDANLTPNDLNCIGICTQRSTFVTWNRETREYFNNFITWKDLRADDLVNKFNEGILMKSMKGVCYSLYMMTRSKRYLAGSVLKLMNSQVTARLIYELQNNEKLKEALKRNTARFDTLDSWLLYKLRKNSKDHISDITSATATGFYDPFTLNWSALAKHVFNIPENILPKVVDNNYNFGYVHESILGHPIKIACSVSDQTASIWGNCCFRKADIKITLGTGSFLNIITGNECHASMLGCYPLVAWKLDKNAVYCVEGASNDTGTLIQWAQSIGLIESPSECSNLAESVPDCDGVYFVPAFSGIGPPVNDYKATSGFIGVRPTTKKAHMIRAILDSIAFRIAQLFICTQEDTKIRVHCIRVDGGVSKCDYVCQTISDLINIKVERAFNTESSALGAAYIAGLNNDLWKSTEEISKFRKVDKEFEPITGNRKQLFENFKMWKQAIDRFGEWY